MIDLFKKKKKKKTSKISRTELACRNAIAGLQKLAEDMNNKKTKESVDGFYKIVRDFLSKFFNLKYEFTHDELRKDIKKKRGIPDEVKKKTSDFFSEFSNVKYKSRYVSKKRLEGFIQDFSDVVHMLFYAKCKKKKK